MADRIVRVTALALGLAALAVLLGSSTLGTPSAYAGRGDKDAVTQVVPLRVRDAQPFGAHEEDWSIRGEVVMGSTVTLQRRVNGIHLEVDDAGVNPGHVYSIWFQFCGKDAAFKDDLTQCDPSTKVINMNGSGGIADASGRLRVSFDLKVGFVVAPANACSTDPSNPDPDLAPGPVVPPDACPGWG